MFCWNLFFMLLMLGFGSVLSADTGTGSPSENGYQWSDKLGRGFLNILSSPLEIPREVNFTSNEKNLGVGWTLGVFQGLGIGLARLGAGAVDLVTSPFPWPDAKRAPLIQPEYPWQEARTKI